MSLLLALTGAAGIGLFVMGLPMTRRISQEQRIEPYLGGLHGRPSALLRTRRDGGSLAVRVARWVERRARAWLPTPSATLAGDLAAADRDEDVEAFRVEQITWAVGACLGSTTLIVMAAAAGMQVDPRMLPALVAISFAAGYLGREWWLGREIRARREVLRDELPVAIDLITLSIVSGESVPAAFARVAGLLQGGMGRECARVIADVRAGAPVVEALEEMARRIPDPGIARFADALCTAIERGAPLADVLRGQADDGRESRRRHLLEMGGRREVLMLVPVVFLIMPVVVLFALFPGLVSLNLLVP